MLSTKVIDDEDRFVVVLFPASSSFQEERLKIIPEWASVPLRIHPCAQVHYNNGIGYDGKAVRVRTINGNFRYLRGCTIKEPGKPWSVVVGLNYESYQLSRLVLESFVGPPPTEDANYACHVDARPVDGVPDNSLSNLRWGTAKDNREDDVERFGRPQDGNCRKIIGRAEGVGISLEFRDQDEAAEKAGVSRRRVLEALKTDGLAVGKQRWVFEWERMEFENDEDVECIDGDKFITSFGRFGELKTVHKDGHTSKAPLEVFHKPYSNGYEVVQFSDTKISKHRLVAEKFMENEIMDKVLETGISWDELRVHHADGNKLNNRVDNLRIVTSRELSEKSARTVVEVDEYFEPIPGRIWKSLSEAARDCGLHSSAILKVCSKKLKTTGGRCFAFGPRIFEEERVSKSLKRKREYLFEED
jgi:hypothetical protein